MTTYAIDLRYAWLQLGLPPGTDVARVEKALEDAHNYRFFTRPRLLHVERFVQFFVAREQFGSVRETFEAIRKTYHRRAMELHPDRNEDNPQAQELLKAINIAYELIDAVHREAREFFAKSEAERKAIEDDARFETARESEAAGAGPFTVNMSYAETEWKRPDPPPQPQQEPPRTKTPPGMVKYMAASIPRFIRASRLFYLGRESIIGSRIVKSPGTVHGLAYDIIMLPELEFNRARLRLSMEGYGVQELTMSKLTPPYIPIDTRELIVPMEERDPAGFARRHFISEYGLEHVYEAP